MSQDISIKSKKWLQGLVFVTSMCEVQHTVCVYMYFLLLF